MPGDLLELVGDDPMTDARYPERWLNDRRFRRITADAHRVYVTSLAWSAGNRTDGWLHASDFDLLPHEPTRAVRDELVGSGLWEEHNGTSYLIIDFEPTQTSATQLAGLEKKRIADRDRQRRNRDSQQSRRDVARDTKARTGHGQARTGREGGNLPERDRVDYSWGSDFDD